MVEKVTTVLRAKLGKRIGRFADDGMVRVNRS
jgi:mRNA-degrading endonuclease toxin of MazEF toxin-antitoxin module